MQHSRGEQEERKHEGTDGKLFRGRVNQGTSWAKDGCRDDAPSGTQLREGRLLGRSRGSLKLELKGLVLGKQAVVIQISGEELQKRVAAMEATRLTKGKENQHGKNPFLQNKNEINSTSLISCLR